MSLLIGERSAKERRGYSQQPHRNASAGTPGPLGPRGCLGYLRLRQTTFNGNWSFHYRISREGGCLPSAGREGQTWRCEGWMVKLNDPQVPQAAGECRSPAQRCQIGTMLSRTRRASSSGQQRHTFALRHLRFAQAKRCWGISTPQTRWGLSHRLLWRERWSWWARYRTCV
jgi:hypothetical protein